MQCTYKTCTFVEPELLFEWDPHSILLGRSEGGRLLVVVHCLRAEGRAIRLISARLANRREHRVYSERIPP